MHKKVLNLCMPNSNYMVNFQSVDRQMLERVCANAKIHLTDSENDRFVSDMGDILAAFRLLEEVNTKAVLPAYHATNIKNVWREDGVKKRSIDIMKNTKAIENGYIIGPKLV